MSHETWMLCHLREMSRKRGKVLQKLRLGCNYGAWSVLELAHRLKPHLPLRCRNMAGRSSTGKNRARATKSKQRNTFPNQISTKKYQNFLETAWLRIFIFPEEPQPSNTNPRFSAATVRGVLLHVLSVWTQLHLVGESQVHELHRPAYMHSYAHISTHRLI